MERVEQKDDSSNDDLCKCGGEGLEEDDLLGEDLNGKSTGKQDRKENKETGQLEKKIPQLEARP